MGKKNTKLTERTVAEKIKITKQPESIDQMGKLKMEITSYLIKLND